MKWDDMTIQQRLEMPFAKLKFRMGHVFVKEKKNVASIFFYVSARDVKKRLDSVFGGQWNNSFPIITDKAISCSITATVDGQSIHREHCGGFESESTKTFMSLSDVRKGTASDAFKRAATMFGIAAYTYDLKGYSAPVQEFKGKYYFVKGFDANTLLPEQYTIKGYLKSLEKLK